MLARLAVGFALVSFAAGLRADPIVYALTLSQEFGTFDLATGGFSSVGSGLPEGSAGLVSGPGGSLLTLAFSGHLISVNPQTGSASLVGATGLGDCSGPESLCGPNSASAFGSLSGTLYATDFANNLYTVDSATGAATLIGPTGMPAVPAPPETVNPDGSVNLFLENLFSDGGNLYATVDAHKLEPDGTTIVSVLTPTVYRINPSSGAATALFPIASGAHLVAVTDVGGTTYAVQGIVDAAHPFDSGSTQVVTLDLSNGSLNFVSGVDPATGVVFGMTAAVPEPAPIVLMGVGVAILAFWRVRRQLS